MPFNRAAFTDVILSLGAPAARPGAPQAATSGNVAVNFRLDSMVILSRRAYA
jgi:hypothetical protein